MVESYIAAYLSSRMATPVISGPELPNDPQELIVVRSFGGSLDAWRSQADATIQIVAMSRSHFRSQQLALQAQQVLSYRVGFQIDPPQELTGEQPLPSLRIMRLSSIGLPEPMGLERGRYVSTQRAIVQYILSTAETPLTGG